MKKARYNDMSKDEIRALVSVSTNKTLGDMIACVRERDIDLETVNIYVVYKLNGHFE